MSVKAVAWALEVAPEIEAPAAKLVLILLADHHNKETGQCNPGVKLLAEESGYGETTVKAALGWLVDNGLVERVRNQRDNGRLGGYEYTFPRVGFRRHQGRLPTVAPGSRADSRNLGSNPEPVDSISSEMLSGPGSESDQREAVQRIYDHWRFCRGKTRASYAKISPGRRQKIVTRLKEFSEADLIAAIDGVASDPWDQRSQHDDLTVIFRSREQVERFIEFAERPPRRTGKRTPSEIANLHGPLQEGSAYDAPGNHPPRRPDRRDLPALESGGRDA